MIKKPGEKKICSKCGRSLEDDMFYKNAFMKDGLANECKDCVKQRGKEPPTSRNRRIKEKIKYICSDLNTTIRTGSFVMNNSILNIDNMPGRMVILEIPLRKRMTLVEAVELLEFAKSEITVLDNIQVELKVFDWRPVIVITGVVKEV